MEVEKESDVSTVPPVPVPGLQRMSTPTYHSKWYVTTRKGVTERFSFDKIATRLNELAHGLDGVDVMSLTARIQSRVTPGIKTSDIDVLTAEEAQSLSSNHPDYSILGARILVDNLHKSVEMDVLCLARKLHNYMNPETGRPAPLLSKAVLDMYEAFAPELQKAIKYQRDFAFDFFAIRTLLRGYLLKMNGETAECPQHMYMRVAVQLHTKEYAQGKPVLSSILVTYYLLSLGVYTHATPSLQNAGLPRPQMSSCFLVDIKDDSIDGIFDTAKDVAMLSKYAGGIGLSVTKIRAELSYINGTNGHSNGLLPMLQVFNNIMRYVDQGGGKRKGSCAIYLEPWHRDIMKVLDMTRQHGKEELRARDLYLGMWIPDLFMKRLKEGKNWTLFCPQQAAGLGETWGDEFEKLYLKYEEELPAKHKVVVPAQKIWFSIIDSQIEKGIPYLLYKDACNRKSNQQNLGTIRSSNLCTEIVEYTAPDEVAVCNLASIALPMFVKEVKGDGKEEETEEGKVDTNEDEEGLGAFTFQRLSGSLNHERRYFDFAALGKVVELVIENLDRVIDLNFYPIKEAEKSNLRHRPIGLGIQGLSDVYIMLGMAFDSDEAKELNQRIFETIYYHSISKSADLAQEKGIYPTFAGSPASEGRLQPDLWDEEDLIQGRETLSRLQPYDWVALQKKARAGLRNSLCVAPMPTASTAQILGNTESIEPVTSNIYSRRVLSGEFLVVNRNLVKDLTDLGLWNKAMKQRIVQARGSVAGIEEIPKGLRSIYKTVWEISQKALIDQAVDRGHFICQSQSLNLYLESPSAASLTSMHFYAWQRGLKTGMYYLRSRPKANPLQFTAGEVGPPVGTSVQTRQRVSEDVQVEVMSTEEEEEMDTSGLMCTGKEDCLACGS